MGKPAKSKPTGSSRQDVLICLALVAITAAVFWRVAGFDYASIDDDQFVRQNTFVQMGLTAQSVKWAFTSTWQTIWQPVTWLSYMLDRQIAAGPGVYHVTSLLFHLASTVLLFILLNLITRSRWRSAFVAILFAIHPLHVESVAWIAERKDVLSTFFCILALLAYARYVKQRTLGAYLLIVLAFALGLMAKPMLVTMPIMLLLLDYWPLNRMAQPTDKKTSGSSWGRLLLEKGPLLIITLAVAAVTLIVMRDQGNIGTSTKFTVPECVAMAIVNYARYIWMMLWPARLTVVYADPVHTIPVWMIVVSIVTLVGISAMVVRLAKRRPYLAFGWLWYVVTLLPVSGLIQQGILIRADHFTYIPLIGVFVMIAWGVPDLATVLGKGHVPDRLLAGAAVLAILVLSVVSYVQVGYWRNSTVIFEHALSVTENNCVSNIGLGVTRSEHNRITEALSLFRKAAQIDPSSEDAHYYLGTLLARLNHMDEAIIHLRRAVELRPDYMMARTYLGLALVTEGKLDEGIAQYRTALKLDPSNQRVLGFLHDAEARKARQH